MKEWEKELYIYRLTPAPPKENNLQKYILNYLARKEDKYISWFLHYYIKHSKKMPALYTKTRKCKEQA